MMQNPESHEPAPTATAEASAISGEFLFGKQKESQEGALQKETEHTLHRERLADQAAGGFGESCPVGRTEIPSGCRSPLPPQNESQRFGPEAGALILRIAARPGCGMPRGLLRHFTQMAPPWFMQPV